MNDIYNLYFIDCINDKSYYEKYLKNISIYNTSLKEEIKNKKDLLEKIEMQLNNYIKVNEKRPIILIYPDEMKIEIQKKILNNKKYKLLNIYSYETISLINREYYEYYKSYEDIEIYLCKIIDLIKEKYNNNENIYLVLDLENVEIFYYLDLYLKQHHPNILINNNRKQ